jgi:hypothetical protein
MIAIMAGFLLHPNFRSFQKFGYFHQTLKGKPNHKLRFYLAVVMFMKINGSHESKKL